MASNLDKRNEEERELVAELFEYLYDLQTVEQPKTTLNTVIITSLLMLFQMPPTELIAELFELLYDLQTVE